MLGDPQSEQFSTSFADQWLSLGTLGSMPPDAKRGGLHGRGSRQ